MRSRYIDAGHAGCRYHRPQGPPPGRSLSREVVAILSTLHDRCIARADPAMLFNSVEFLLVFLPAAILIYRVADDHAAARTWVLIALSLIFYGYWDVRFVPLMIGSILLNWYAARC